jgi:hypothetical protein
MTASVVIAQNFPVSKQFRMGLALPEATRALGKLLGEEGVASLHDDLYERAYHRLKRKGPTGSIKSDGAIAAIWQGVKVNFDLGEFDAKTEWLVSELIRMTYAALEEHDNKALEHFTNPLIAADANQRPVGAEDVVAACTIVEQLCYKIG